MGARGVAPYPEATLSVKVREMDRLESAIVDRTSGAPVLSKNLLTLCFFSGYPFLRRED